MPLAAPGGARFLHLSPILHPELVAQHHQSSLPDRTSVVTPASLTRPSCLPLEGPSWIIQGNLPTSSSLTKAHPQSLLCCVKSILGSWVCLGDRRWFGMADVKEPLEDPFCPSPRRTAECAQPSLWRISASGPLHSDVTGHRDGQVLAACSDLSTEAGPDGDTVQLHIRAGAHYRPTHQGISSLASSVGQQSTLPWLAWPLVVATGELDTGRCSVSP